jgi:hypothetical protein
VFLTHLREMTEKVNFRLKMRSLIINSFPPKSPSSVVDLDLDRFFSDPYLDPDPTFQLVSDPSPDPNEFFSNILNIIFSFAFPSSKCVAYYDEI